MENQDASLVPVVVFDLESTCWEDRDKREDMETIEIGAVKLDYRYEIVSELQIYIRPVVEPVLSDLCKQITGITQEQVDAGIGFEEAFGQFAEWADPPVRLVSWGYFDITQLKRDCNRHEMLLPPWVTENHLNLRKLFEKRYGHDRGYSKMEVAMGTIGMEFEGSPHSGIDDARNAARIAARFGGMGRLGRP